MIACCWRAALERTGSLAGGGGSYGTQELCVYLAWSCVVTVSV